jgi:hypothetical protein
VVVRRQGRSGAELAARHRILTPQATHRAPTVGDETSPGDPSHRGWSPYGGTVTDWPDRVAVFLMGGPLDGRRVDAPANTIPPTKLLADPDTGIVYVPSEAPDVPLVAYVGVGDRLPGQPWPYALSIGDDEPDPEDAEAFRERLAWHEAQVAPWRDGKRWTWES